MKYTIINGLNSNNNLQEHVMKQIKECFNKTELYNWINLQDHNINYCTGCDYCQTNNPGICAINDAQKDILENYLQSETVIIITDIIFGSCNSITKKFIDRAQPLCLPYQIKKNGKSQMKGRYPKYPDLLIVGISNQDKGISHSIFENFIQNCNLFLWSESIKVMTITKASDTNAFVNIIQ